MLDLRLPGADGIDLMETVPELADIPVIFISAYGRDETVARALERGAADYLVKPFSATELTARIQAALRRRAGPETLVLGELTVDYEARRVTVGGRPVRLTATEYELLRLLTVNAGRVSTYESLIRRLWNGPDGAIRTGYAPSSSSSGASSPTTRPGRAGSSTSAASGYRVPRPEE